MNIPRCNKCQTDRFLTFTGAGHGHTEYPDTNTRADTNTDTDTDTVTNSVTDTDTGAVFGTNTESLTASLTGDRNGPVDHVVHYFCQACGTNDGHAVPEDWVQPPDAPDVAELRERGEIWLTPTQRSVRKADGRWITSVEV